MTGRAISLFSGVGALDLAVADVFGAHPVAFSEFEANPSKVLAARWPGVPNLGDVREAAWEDWAGVDVLHGGPPCQPTSSAGKRKGESDDRWMWPAALDAMRRVRPRWVVWENPSALLGLDDGEPFGRILSEMAAMGYVGSYGCLRASDVGCCHGRHRLFILGRLASDAGGGESERRRGPGELPRTPSGGEGAHGERQRVRAGVGASGSTAPDAHRTGLEGRRAVRGGGGERTAGPGGVALPLRSADGYDRWRVDHSEHEDADGFLWPYGRREDWTAAVDATDERHERGGRARRRGTGSADGGDPAAADADLAGSEARSGRPGRRHARRCEPVDGGPTDWGDYAPAIARHAAMLGRPAPSPVDDRGRLSATFTEWMMAFPPGWVTDVLPRNPALKALGNAVVRPQAAQAMRLLLARVERITEPDRLTAVR